MSNIYCFKFQFDSIICSEMPTSIHDDVLTYIRFECDGLFFYFNTKQFTEYVKPKKISSSCTVYLVTQKIFDNHYWVHWLSYDFEYTFAIPSITNKKLVHKGRKRFWRLVSIFFITCTGFIYEMNLMNFFVIMLVLSSLPLFYWLINHSLEKYYSSKEVLELYNVIDNISIDIFTCPEGKDTRTTPISIDELTVNAPEELTIIEGVAEVSSVIEHSAGSYSDGTYVDFCSVYLTCNNNDICFQWKRCDSYFVLRWDMHPPFISTGDELILFFSEENNKEININKRIARGRVDKEYNAHIYPEYIYNKADGSLYRSWFATPIKKHPYFSSLNESYPCYQKI